ncbi:MAG: zinc ribbon domain-containing protein [Candidatus Aminicenantes bacterium]|nr:zinc ribbon domain-containing protein [Candidatus Aminicenantes bacterium]
MPIYEYKCKECGKTSEIFFRSRQEHVKPACSFCGSKNLEKIISSPASVRMGGFTPGGRTCCGREERCDTPPCTQTGSCRKDT